MVIRGEVFTDLVIVFSSGPFDGESLDGLCFPKAELSDVFVTVEKSVGGLDIANLCSQFCFNGDAGSNGIEVLRMRIFESNEETILR